MPDYLFVYGLLRPDATGEPHPLLAGAARLVGPAQCRGKLYLVADYPGLVASGHPHDLVHGEVYVIDSPLALLPRLDDFEGCGPRGPRPTEFVRRSRAVWLDDATIIAAWVYLYNWSTDGLHHIESGDFLQGSNTHPPSR
jgi:gamma-glutamylcyclotransferase (GGCT)/AIG2-like uncharacterized protein YtfP